MVPARPGSGAAPNPVRSSGGPPLTSNFRRLTINLTENWLFKAKLHAQPTVQQQEIELKFLISLLKDESGVTAIEYGLIAALIGVAAVGAFSLAGTNISTTFSTVASKL